MDFDTSRVWLPAWPNCWIFVWFVLWNHNVKYNFYDRIKLNIYNGNFFFKDLVKEKIKNNFQFLNEKIQKHQFFAIVILRFIGGIPIQIQNLIPVLFNIKLRHYFWGTLVGVFPQAWIIVSLGSGLEKQIKKNSEPPSFFELLSSSEIYIPILAFATLFVVTFFLRNFFLKK